MYYSTYYTSMKQTRLEQIMRHVSFTPSWCTKDNEQV